MLIRDEWRLTPQRVAIHVPTATAVLADLHLGYHAARQRRGEAVPTPALADLLRPLADVLARWSLSRIVVAGDLFEDGVDDGVVTALGDWLANQGTTLFAVVPGNHDRRLADGVPGIAVFPEGFALQSWLIVHGDGALPRRPVVCGHWHPALTVGRRKHPCYLAGKRSLILPAYSKEARGVAVNASRAWRGHRCYVPVGTEVLDFGTVGGVHRFTSTAPANNRGRMQSGRTTSARPAI